MSDGLIDYDDVPEIAIGPPVTPDYVDRRVEDWFRRLHDLFGSITTWGLAHGWTVREGDPVRLDEERMRQVGAPARNQPTLSLVAPNGEGLLVQPVAIWTIGANGRIAILSKKFFCDLVDVAEEFEPPRWTLYRLRPGQAVPFSPTLLADMV